MSLIEIMVAMTLLVVLMLGLFSAFYQSQRALRLSASQTDVLEGGRSLMALLTRELTELAPSHQLDGVNLKVVTFPGVTMRLLGSTERTNVLQDFFFLSRRGDVWTGLGYFFPPGKEGIGPLYRFTVTNQLGSTFQMASLHQAFADLATHPPESWTNVGRVAEGVVHLQLRAYDTNGLEYIPVGGAVYGPPLAPGIDVLDDGYVFANQMLPAWIDVEIGVVDPNVFRQYKALAELNPAAGVIFLKNQAGKVYLFRQRIPIRNHHEP